LHKAPQLGDPSLPLTRNPRADAQIPTSPRKRGEGAALTGVRKSAKIYDFLRQYGLQWRIMLRLSDPTAIIEFGHFSILPHRRQLLAEGRPIRLGGRAFGLLLALIEPPGAVVGKDELLGRIWPGRIVEENRLQSEIWALRKAFGADRDLIQTVSGRGYQFAREIRKRGAGVSARQLPVPPAVPAPPRPAARADGIGLEDLREAISAFQQCVSEIVGRHSGFIASRLGNTVLVLFGYPAAHEHDAEQSIRAGLELFAAVRTLRPDADVPMGAGSA
jgi:DNA-binding winged helix-turn-helix (wHTH) protein